MLKLLKQEKWGWSIFFKPPERKQSRTLSLLSAATNSLVLILPFQLFFLNKNKERSYPRPCSNSQIK